MKIWWTFALIWGCSSQAPLVLSADPAMTGEQFAALQEAASEWNACGIFPIEVTRDLGFVPVIPSKDLPVGQLGLTLTHGPEVRWIRFRPVNSYAWTRETLAHELGHALGLAHRAEGIMNPDADPTRRVQHEDCEYLRVENNFRWM